MSGVTRIYKIPNEFGLHLRAAAALAHVASGFDSDINVSCGSKTVSAKSTLGLVTLGAGENAEVSVTAVGRDAQSATSAIADLFATNFSDGLSAD